MENDVYNSGPLIIEFVRYLIEQGDFPGESFDINQARMEQQRVLQKLRMKSPEQVSVETSDECSKDNFNSLPKNSN